VGRKNISKEGLMHFKILRKPEMEPEWSAAISLLRLAGSAKGSKSTHTFDRLAHNKKS
jgi:hypothetical protein